MKTTLKSIFSLLFFPFAIISTVQKSKSLLIKILTTFVSLLFLFPLWVFLVFLLIRFSFLSFYYSGAIPIQVHVSGSSMLPSVTQSDGFVLVKPYPGFAFFTRLIERGDLVVFRNRVTDEELKKENMSASGFLKRVIALSGDTISIRDGYVYVNNKPLTERYTLKQRSTFGRDFLHDCNVLTVPKGKIFVLGDNRKRSDDSRHIGFVDLKDISFVMPWQDQKKYKSRWISMNDYTSSHTSFLDIDQYVLKVNEKRKALGLQELSLNAKLSQAAKKRAEIMIATDDFSPQASRSGLTMKNAIEQTGYSNIIYGEIPSLGYYDDSELIDYMVEFQDSEKILLNKDYQDIGVSTFVGELEGCPVQIVVQQFGGYVPPNYSQATIDSWVVFLQGLKDIQIGWRTLKSSGQFYQDHRNDIDRINDIIATRIQNTQAVLDRMKANQWLTKDEQNYIDFDEKLSKEQEEIANRLNGSH